MNKSEISRRLVALESTRSKPFPKVVLEHPAFQTMANRFEEFEGESIPAVLRKARLARWNSEISDEAAELMGDMLTLAFEIESGRGPAIAPLGVR